MGESVQTGRIDIKFIIVKCHRRLIDVGEKFPAYHLIAVIIESTGALQKLFLSFWRWRMFLYICSIRGFRRRIRQLGL